MSLPVVVRGLLFSSHQDKNACWSSDSAARKVSLQKIDALSVISVRKQIMVTVVTIG